MIACEIKNAGTSAVLGKIMELQHEIAQINLHERLHVNGESAHFEPTCSYCKIAERQSVDDGRKKSSSIVSELERQVESSGKSGAVLVPKSWAGKRVKVILLE